MPLYPLLKAPPRPATRTAATSGRVVNICQERLAAYEYPPEVVVLAELPMGGGGKVLDTELHASP